MLHPHVPVVGPRVVPPAKMNSDLLRRDALQGLVQDSHMKIHHALPRVQTQVLELGVPGQGQVGAVHLQHESFAHDGPVLHAHCHSNPFQVVGVCWVDRLGVVVEEHGHGARRWGRPEGLAGHAGIIGPEPVPNNVALAGQSLLPDVLDPPYADGVAGLHALVQRDQPGAGQESAGHAAELAQILWLGGGRPVLLVLEFESGHPLGRVGGVVQPANLAVVDDSDAEGELLAHHVIQLRPLVFRGLCPGQRPHVSGLDHIRKPRQGPGVECSRMARDVLRREIQGHCACRLLHGSLLRRTLLRQGWRDACPATAGHISLHVCPCEFTSEVSRQVSCCDAWEDLFDAEEELRQAKAVDSRPQNELLRLHLHRCHFSHQRPEGR